MKRNNKSINEAHCRTKWTLVRHIYGHCSFIYAYWCTQALTRLAQVKTQIYNTAEWKDNLLPFHNIWHKNVYDCYWGKINMTNGVLEAQCNFQLTPRAQTLLATLNNLTFKGHYTQTLSLFRVTEACIRVQHHISVTHVWLCGRFTLCLLLYRKMLDILELCCMFSSQLNRSLMRCVWDRNVSLGIMHKQRRSI